MARGLRNIEGRPFPLSGHLCVSPDHCTFAVDTRSSAPLEPILWTQYESASLGHSSERGLAELNVGVEVVDTPLETKNIEILERRIVIAHLLGELVDASTSRAWKIEIAGSITNAYADTFKDRQTTVRCTEGAQGCSKKRGPEQEGNPKDVHKVSRLQVKFQGENFLGSTVSTERKSAESASQVRADFRAVRRQDQGVQVLFPSFCCLSVNHRSHDGKRPERGPFCCQVSQK